MVFKGTKKVLTSKPYPMQLSKLPKIHTFSLTEFVDRGTYLANRFERDVDGQPDPLSKDKAQTELVHFMLTGQDRRRNRTARISALADAVTEEQAQRFRVRYDFDSMLGVTDDLPYTTAISVYPVADPRKRINSSLHVKYTIQDNGGSGVRD